MWRVCDIRRWLVNAEDVEECKRADQIGFKRCASAMGWYLAADCIECQGKNRKEFGKR